MTAVTGADADVPIAAILLGEIAADAAPDEQDGLVQAAAIATALRALGFTVETLAAAAAALRALAPALTINLVESIGGQGRLVHLAPALLDALGLAYSGAGTEALLLTSNKPLAKRLLRQAGIDTPDWVEAVTPESNVSHGSGPWIVKSVWEHASIGLDATAIVADAAALPASIAARRRRFGGDWFAERFIDGREFNLSLLGTGGEPMLLPAAEIRFVDFPPAKPRIVDYAAKWHPESFEYRHTQRVFPTSAADAPLLQRLGTLAGACWTLFGLRGYARVDFRVDTGGTPWVLEVNANPCLSPDAGFVAAAERAGLDFAAVIRRIVADLNRPPAPPRQVSPPAAAVRPADRLRS